MNQQTKWIGAALSLMLTASAFADTVYLINPNQSTLQSRDRDNVVVAVQNAPAEARLPNAVTAWVGKTFASPIASYEIDRDDGIIEYEIELRDGTQIDINAGAQWHNVEHSRSIAAANRLLPPAALSYIKQHYPNRRIREISREHGTVEVELNRGTELLFDGQGAFLGSKH